MGFGGTLQRDLDNLVLSACAWGPSGRRIRGTWVPAPAGTSLFWGSESYVLLGHNSSVDCLVQFLVVNHLTQ